MRLAPCLSLAICLALAPLPLAAADGPDKVASGSGAKGERSRGQPDQKSDDVDTENLFGFTEGADAGDKGQQEVLVDTVTRLGKRRSGPGPADYRVTGTKLSYQVDPVDRFTVEIGLFGDAHRVRNTPDLADKDFSAFDGASIELKYQFLKGSAAQPFGLAVELRNRYARILPIEGMGADIYDFEGLIQADWQVVPNKVWLGANLSYEPQVGRLRGTHETDRSSTLLWSTALVMQVAPGSFLGPELRYARAYEGAWLNRFQGEALTVGPAFNHRFSDKVFLTIAYTMQVAGRDREPGGLGRTFDLNHFERRALRVKLGAEF